MELIIRIGMFFISWTSLAFLKKKEVVRYSPSAIIVSLFLSITTLINPVIGLWEVKGTKRKQVLADLSFIFGPFICASIWALKLTFGRAPVFFLLNIVNNIFLAYPATAFFEKHNLYKLKKLNRHYLFLLCTSYSIILYGYQTILEKAFSRIFLSKDLDAHRFEVQSAEILKEKYHVE